MPVSPAFSALDVKYALPAVTPPDVEPPPVLPRIAHGASRFAIALRSSPIHRFGLFAVEAIPPHERIIEYAGERISYREAARRSQQPIIYLLWVAPGRVIDGSVGGSGAEFANHSCAPNVAVEISDGHAWFVSRRAIAAGEELLLDYKMRSEERLACRCGSPQCRGYLNA